MSLQPTPITALLWALLSLAPVDASADTMVGRVVGIADGDTLTVLIDHERVHIRIAGIDAPEKKQPFSQRSKQSLSECAFGSEVEVQWSKKDRYGRTVGKVIANGMDCGLRQIEEGLAWHYKAYAKEQSPRDRVLYAEAEEIARRAQRGLWTEQHPKPPWEFRHPQPVPSAAGAD